MKSHVNRRTDLDDPRVVAALDEYLTALEGGQKPERQAFLARHAEIADALTECLEGMEALHEASSASHLTGNAFTAPGDWPPGTPLGDYRIVREIGRGGMGVVYEAEQLSLGRRIALKVLPFALTLDPRQLQRFKNEARAAAQLHHQHIVPVYAVGSERGVHFYAMQYIEGQSLAEVIQGLREQAQPATGETPAPRGPAERGASTGPYLTHLASPATDTAVKANASLATAYSANSSGSYRTVARLGIQAAQALEHAHEYGVVHRDIKPGNLLLDAHGNAWITDFGLAQFQTDVGLTQTGDLLGTLRYMSPEQAGGPRLALDHRTDIYSLGATLYELLTLHPPFDGGDRQTLLHQILNDEPRPPRSIQKSIPVELETIVLKALAKTPSERYSTAKELADDLSRFLEYQPIRARRASTMQRLRKWGRRHPSVVWAAGVLCLLTAAGSLVSAEMVRREQVKTEAAYQEVQRAQVKTEAAYQKERAKAREAEEEFQLAREAVDGMFKLCEAELADKPFLDGLRRRLLEEFLVYYQKLIEQHREDPTAQAELSATRDRVQSIREDLAELQGASRHLLLREPPVLKDLQVDDGQRKRIELLNNDMNKRYGASFHEFGRLSADERRERLVEMTRGTENEIKDILTDAQRGRLREIDLQRKGVRAFEESDVIQFLKMTPKQNEQIRALQQESCEQGLNCHLERGGKPQIRKPPFDVEQIKQKVLTQEQRQRWGILTGKPAPPPPPPPPAWPPGQHGWGGKKR
jgi:serine/threonine protein kinase